VEWGENAFSVRTAFHALDSGKPDECNAVMKGFDRTSFLN
jgi:hypothetical protein